MQETELFRWWMPPTPMRPREYLSDHMTHEQARAAGALRPEPASRLVVRPAGDTTFGRHGAIPVA